MTQHQEAKVASVCTIAAQDHELRTPSDRWASVSSRSRLSHASLGVPLEGAPSARPSTGTCSEELHHQATFKFVQ